MDLSPNRPLHFEESDACACPIWIFIGGRSRIDHEENVRPLGSDMLSICRGLTIILWIAHEILWGVYSRGNKETAQKGKTTPRLISLAAIVLGFVLIYAPFFSIGILGTKLTPENIVSAAAGVLLCAAGICFAWWSRITLGSNWSGAITIKEGHELIQRGPYAIVRHPIYSGLLLAILGSAVVMNELKGFLAVLLILLGLLKKIEGEELLLGSHFKEYSRYKLQAKKLIPYLY